MPLNHYHIYLLYVVYSIKLSISALFFLSNLYSLPFHSIAADWPVIWVLKIWLHVIPLNCKYSVMIYMCLCILFSVADFIRHTAQMSHHWDTIRQLPPQSLNPMFDGVNVVSNCAWTVNKPVSSSVCFWVIIMRKFQFGYLAFHDLASCFIATLLLH